MLRSLFAVMNFTGLLLVVWLVRDFLKELDAPDPETLLRQAEDASRERRLRQYDSIRHD